MLFSEIRRFFTWLTHPRANGVAVSAPSFAERSSALEFDPTWHGDHWQNLLSCPMDARHYVMEDWSIPVSDDWDDIDGVASAH